VVAEARVRRAGTRENGTARDQGPHAGKDEPEHREASTPAHSEAGQNHTEDPEHDRDGDETQQSDNDGDDGDLV
jgi:hypothetical protein